MITALPIKQALSTPENLSRVAEWIDCHPDKNRTDLAKELCQQMGWRDHAGLERVSTTLKALRDLEEQGHYKLPDPLISGPRGWKARRLEHPVPSPQAVPELVQDVRGLALMEVRTPEHLRIWNELMCSEHPLKEARLVGKQLRYLIGSDHGWLGGIGFGSAALHMECRDRWIGWDQPQRTEHWGGLINMSRFLIRPGVHGKGLSSHVLSLSAQRLCQDFYRRYGQRPWMLESFVDEQFHDGTCYQAANWICVGPTKGRGRNGDHQAGQSIKSVYLYPLVSNFRKQLGIQLPRLSPLKLESGLDAEQWALQEFGQCPLGDERLTARLVEIAASQGAHPSGSYAEAVRGDRVRLKGYYRLLNNPRPIGLEQFLGTHRLQSIRRMGNEQVALAINDTTDMNLSDRLHCQGLGEIGTNQTQSKSKGLKLHSTLAVNTRGQPLGVLRINGYAPESQGDKDPDRPMEQKESYRWIESFVDVVQAAKQIPETRVVFVTDREGDIFELFDQQRRQTTSVDLLIRSQYDRCLEDTENKLFQEMAQSPLAGEATIHVPRQRETKGKPSKPGRAALPAREAQVEVRFKKVRIAAPSSPQTRGKAALELYVVYVVEKDPPAGAKPIRWCLLTTVQVTSVVQAMKIVRWYCLRWRIEEWHRVLKSGCKILGHQNHSAEALFRAVAIDAVIAWRIMLLALLGRDLPEMPADLLFDQWECNVLETLSQKKRLSLGEAIIIIAKLGGYLNRKCDGPPGFASLLRGYVRFHDMVYFATLLRQPLDMASAMAHRSPEARGQRRMRRTQQRRRDAESSA